MAFLDNSGDIILDAVLTDVGRKKMARGNFKVVKFALGDDEIDYGLYNKNHPSGSAYYDLEILQTPILEAFTQANASLNYGLVTYARNDLLYLPSIVLNNKNSALTNVAVKHATHNVIYLANDTKLDGSSNMTSDLLNSDLGDKNSVLISGRTDDKYLLIETGLNTTELRSSSTNQNTYLLSVGLNDNKFIIQCNKRFIASVMGPAAASFAMTSTGGSLTVTLKSQTEAASAAGLSGYKEIIVEGVTSRLYPATTGTDTTTTYSNITGPRGAFCALNFNIDANISQNDFAKYGRTSYALFGSSNLYDYVDSIVYVRGINTNIVLQVPIRIIQAAQ